MRKIRKFVKLDAGRRRDLVVAIHAIWLARCKLALMPVWKIIERMQQIRLGQRDINLHQAERIAWALRASGHSLPWRSDCLVQAIAAMTWAARIGLTAELHLGVRKSGQTDLEAHAWVISGDTMLCGGVPDLSSYHELDLSTVSSKNSCLPATL